MYILFYFPVRKTKMDSTSRGQVNYENCFFQPPAWTIQEKEEEEIDVMNVGRDIITSERKEEIMREGNCQMLAS